MRIYNQPHSVQERDLADSSTILDHTPVARTGPDPGNFFWHPHESLRHAINKPMPSDEDLKAEIERLRAENEALKKPAARGQMSLKVSEKGALSVYGLGRFPVTLYREQWERLLGMADEIRAFILENDGALKKKE